MSISYNEKQQAAIEHKDGPMLVLAGPGCGKTAVITGRIKKLIDSGVSPDTILVVTFTVAAAAEMRERFFALYEKDAKGITISTFHSIFYRIIRDEYRLGHGSILSENRKLELIKNILHSSYDDSYYKNELAGNVAQEISLVKGSGISSKNYYSVHLPSEVFAKVFNEYRRWLAENRMLDFDDINTCTYQLFKERPEVLSKWQERFEYILVDEFQDINRLQYILLKMLAAPQNNLFIVGDDDQSIYRFRGSSPEIMLRFPEEYKGCAITELDQNYRSTPQIIDAAGKVISKNKKRYKKNLRTAEKNGADVDIRVFDNIWKELDALSLNIRKANERGVPFNEIAVLVRTNMGAGPALERLLSDRIPYTAKAEVPLIYDHFIAKDIMAYFNIACGKRTREDFLRILNKPNRYISRYALYDKNVSFEHLYIYYEGRIWMCKRIEELEENIHILKDLPPYGGIQFIRKVIGYDTYIKEYAAERRIPFEDLSQLMDEIAQSARPYGTYEQWTDHIRKFREMSKNAALAGDEKSSVTISTFHGSKGMEYDIVFLLDVNEGVIPYHKAAGEAQIEEERRLLYVGMTRARKELHIYAVRERYEKKMKVSEFLEPVLTKEQRSLNE